MTIKEGEALRASTSAVGNGLQTTRTLQKKVNEEGDLLTITEPPNIGSTRVDIKPLKWYSLPSIDHPPNDDHVPPQFYSVLV
jgi:hypothetical protein